jgi:hypothetical protein
MTLAPFTHWTMNDQTLASIGQMCSAHHTRTIADRLAWRIMQRQRVVMILRDKTLTDADARASALAEIEDNPY